LIETAPGRQKRSLARDREADIPTAGYNVNRAPSADIGLGLKADFHNGLATLQNILDETAVLAEAFLEIGSLLTLIGADPTFRL